MAIKTDTFSSAGGGAGSDTLDDVTGRGATTTNAITVGGLSVGSAYSMPTADGSTGQAIISDGAGNLSFSTIDPTGALEYKGSFNATAGTPSLANAEQGDYYKIDTAGTIYGQTWAVGDSLLINADMGGSITNSKIDKIDNTDTPASETVAGVIEIATNLEAQGASATDKALVPSNISSIALSSFNDDLSYLSSGDNVSELTNDAGYLTTVASASETVAGKIEIATNLEAQGASATDKALVPSNISSIALSSFNDDLSYLSNGDNISLLSNDAGYLTSVGGLPLQTVVNPANASANNAYYNTTASGNQAIFTLPAISGLADGDTFVFNRKNAGELVIRQNDYADANPTARVEYFGSVAVSHTVQCNNQQFIVRYDSGGSKFYIFDKAQALVATSGELGDLTDVTISSVANGEVLKYDSTASAWVNGTASASTDTLDDVTGRGATTTNAITVGGLTTSGDIVADADSTRTIGAEANRFITSYSDLNGAIRFKAKNDEGSQITKGQAVYIKGISGTVPTVGLADADDANKMPAFGLAYANANDQAEVQIVSFGNLTDVNTSTFTAGDTLYVDTTAGALTATKPTGSTAQLQNIGRVLRSDASAGIIKVGGAGRSAATPNLDEGHFFVGNASNQSTQSAYQLPTAIGTNGQVLTSDGTNVTFQTASAGSLGGLSDVGLGSLSDNQILQYDSSNSRWTNATPQAFIDYFSMTGDVPTSFSNRGYLVSADNLTLTLPAYTSSLLKEGDSIAVTSNGRYTLTIDGNGSDTFYSVISAGNVSSETFIINKQEILIRYNGSKWYLIEQPNEVVNDNTPQLGGDLDTNQNELVTASNRDLILRPNGTGHVMLGGNDNPAELHFYCETNDQHFVGFKAPAHSELSGSTVWRLPTADASTSGDALVSDGAGNLSFTTIGGGGGSAPTVTSASPGSNYTISTHADNEEIYLLTPSADISVFLPAASSCGSGYKYQIKNLGAYTLTIDPDSSEYIDHSGQTTFNIVQYESITLVTDGSNWFII